MDDITERNTGRVEAILSRCRTKITLHLPYASKNVTLTAGDLKTALALLDTLTGLNPTARLIQRLINTRSLIAAGSQSSGETVTHKLVA